MTTSLNGQVAVVTGGGRGIGREIARQLAQHGATVAVSARTREQLDKTVNIITEAGGNCTAFVMDVSDVEIVQRVLSEIEAQLGSIELLVNNAGVSGKRPLPWALPVADWWYTLEVNVRGVFACAHAVLPGMIARKKGRIINVGSNIGLYAVPDATAYSVSKAALISLSTNLAEATRGTGVSVFAISPGLVLTDMTRDIPNLEQIPASEWVPIEKSGALCVALASGDADQLSGCYIHAQSDDIQDLIARADEINEQGLYRITLNL